MKLRKLQIENFRNYGQYSHEFDPDKNLTILVGPNGIGKTNFLEAIYVLSLGRSFRSLHRDDLIEWEKDYSRCSATVESANDDTTLEVFCSCRPTQIRNFKKNGVNLKNSEYLGNLLTVLFHPEDLNMLYLSPSLRRKYLDIILCQTDRKYLNALTQYRHVLKQRNALLHEIRKAQFDGGNTERLKKDLDAWDTEIVEFGSYVVGARLVLVEFLSSRLTDIYRSISGRNEKIAIAYLSRATKNYAENLLDRRQRDIIQAETGIGPHRDDLSFEIDGKEISTSASRGEFRTLLLAIKLAEIRYIEEKTGEKPVLLLDDVFSELDHKRQRHLLKSIRDCQTIITTTDTTKLQKIAKESSSIELVEKG